MLSVHTIPSPGAVVPMRSCSHRTEPARTEPTLSSRLGSETAEITLQVTRYPAA